MLKASTEFVIIFIIISVLLIIILTMIIAMIIFKYQQKQNIHQKKIEALKISYENSLLQSQLEIQEQTFQNIAREIHDNIGQKLTLAKLHLNTLRYDKMDEIALRVNDSVDMISEAINDLSDISRSMNSELILSNGLIKALEFEAAQLKKSGRYKISFSATGDPVFMDTSKELVLFRIAQEAMNNIVKHACASAIDIQLHYNNVDLTMTINDDGHGFHAAEHQFGTGLLNMKKRATLLKGKLIINSTPGICTQIKIEIPLYETIKTL